jgi:hypothetical protein
MKAVKPFGNLDTATILVIGHDPRLQRSLAEAEEAFFFDYLTRPRPSHRPEARKYDLAQAVWDYVGHLTGREIALTELYVTNLCNEFLPPQSGTILIPEAQARRGVEQIKQIVESGRFRVILPMSNQVFYHLCQLNFIDEDSELVSRFIQAARPQPGKARQGIYQQSRPRSFLIVCGQKFYHRSVPVVPILHIKQWPLKKRFGKYKEPMQQAQKQVQSALGTFAD